MCGESEKLFYSGSWILDSDASVRDRLDLKQENIAVSFVSCLFCPQSEKVRSICLTGFAGWHRSVRL